MTPQQPNQTIAITSSGDEARDYDMIERVADGLVSDGWQPLDAEPGEWLWLTKDDQLIEITIGHADDGLGDWTIETVYVGMNRDLRRFKVLDASGTFVPGGLFRTSEEAAAFIASNRHAS